jgi:hypothetical protein
MKKHKEIIIAVIILIIIVVIYYAMKTKTNANNKTGQTNNTTGQTNNRGGIYLNGILMPMNEKIINSSNISGTSSNTLSTPVKATNGTLLKPDYMYGGVDYPVELPKATGKVMPTQYGISGTYPNQYNGKM